MVCVFMVVNIPVGVHRLSPMIQAVLRTISPIAPVQGGRCPWYAGRGGYFSVVVDKVVEAPGRAGRDAEADPYGAACSADHRDYAVAVRAGWSMSLLCRAGEFNRRRVWMSVVIPQLQLVENSCWRR